MPYKALLLLISISVSGSVLAANSDQAREWLERMTRAMNQMDYQGTFVYIRDNSVETMRITHVIDANGVRERMYSVSGPQREIIRDKNGVHCVLKDSGSALKNPVIALSYFPQLPLSAIGNPAGAYRLKVRGSARIAGQSARRVSILPADAYRYGYDFWLDDQTGLLLKWVLKDSNHQVLAKLMFTDIVMGADVDKGELETDSDSSEFIEMKTLNPQKVELDRSRPHWQLQHLPPGFRLTSYSHRDDRDGLFEHTVYGDGLAAVSIYVEKQDGSEQVRQGDSQLGTNHAYIRRQGNLQITVIGEVPAITVRTMANEMATSVGVN